MGKVIVGNLFKYTVLRWLAYALPYADVRGATSVIYSNKSLRKKGDRGLGLLLRVVGVELSR